MGRNRLLHSIHRQSSTVIWTSKTQAVKEGSAGGLCWLPLVFCLAEAPGRQGSVRGQQLQMQHSSTKCCPTQSCSALLEAGQRVGRKDEGTRESQHAACQARALSQEALLQKAHYNRQASSAFCPELPVSVRTVNPSLMWKQGSPYFSKAQPQVSGQRLEEHQAQRLLLSTGYQPVRKAP